MRSSTFNLPENPQECNAVTSSNGINLQETQASSHTTPNAGNLQTAKDDVRDLTALMVASSTIPTNTKSRSDKASTNSGGVSKGDTKKRVKLHRDVARDLSLLLPDSEVMQDEKAFGYAQAYYLKVKDRLDEQSFTQFINVLNSFDTKSKKVTDLYCEIISLLKPHPDLSEEFLAFLLPRQAMELGVYMEYLCVTKMRHFLRKLEVYFGKQPQQVRKIYECLTRLVEQSSVEQINQTTIRNVILPLLKGSTLLSEYFLQLFPSEQPPVIECSDNKDFEKVVCDELDECNTENQNFDDDSQDWETVEIPDVDVRFGGDNCPCICHQNLSSSTHCFSCGIKFINGRVFVQWGKVLRPAELVVEGPNKQEIIDRIAKKPTEDKIDDEKSTVRQRKRPATDVSPNKGVTGTNSSTNSTGTTETDEDGAVDPKPTTPKVKSPRGVKSIKLLKTKSNSNESSSKDKNQNLVEKNKAKTTQPTENGTVIFDSFVLLNDLKDGNNLKEKTSENIVNESEHIESEDKTNKCEDDNEKPTDKDLTPSTPCRNVSEVNLIRDDEEDDVEYIYIDDDDDEVDDDCVEIEEDDQHDDGEDEEEYDEDDIEEVDIDEEFDREMDVDDIHYENDSSDKNSSKISNSDIKQPIRDVLKSSGSVDIKPLLIKIKEEPIEPEDNNITPILIDNIKMEVDEDDEDKNISSEPSTKFTPVSIQFEADSSSEVNPFSTEQSICDKIENSMSVDSSKACETITENPVSTASPSISAISVSWTKEEDKVILQTIQQENDTDETFITIRQRLPQRSVEEIKSRFHILMLLLKRMTTNKNME